MTYSLKKGFYKGLLSLIPVSIGLITYFGIYDLSVWDLLTKYTQPFLASITIGGLATMLVNYVKFSVEQQIATNKAGSSPKFTALYNGELIDGSNAFLSGEEMPYGVPFRVVKVSKNAKKSKRK